jgi:hypothetical protein
MQNFDHNIGKTPIFWPKIGKNAENCDHNIDPWKRMLVSATGSKPGLPDFSWCMIKKCTK